MCNKFLDDIVVAYVISLHSFEYNALEYMYVNNEMNR